VCTDTDAAIPPRRKSLLFFAFTPVRDDFTSLSSFGSVDQVRATSNIAFEVR
jgi:hypothetical protein